MPALEPYEALFFFGADDVDEVNAEYEKMQDARDEDGSYYTPDLAARVTVVAVEYDYQSRAPGAVVWFLRDGMIERRESWLVRKAFY